MVFRICCILLIGCCRIFAHVAALTKSSTVEGIQLHSPSLTGSIYFYGQRIRVEFSLSVPSQDLKNGGDYYCLQVDAESFEDEERTKCLSPSQSAIDAQVLEIQGPNPGTHSIRVFLRRPDMSISAISPTTLVDIVPARGGSLFLPSGPIPPSLSCESDAYADDGYAIPKIWRSFEGLSKSWNIVPHNTREVTLITVGRRRTRANIGFVGLGTEFGGQELFDMNQIAAIERHAVGRAVYITPKNALRIRMHELRVRNITYVTFNDADDLARVLRRLELDVVVVALHDARSTLRTLYDARDARIPVRVLTMPNMFGTLEATELCDAAHVVIFPSCYARSHPLTKGCRASRATVISMPPAALSPATMKAPATASAPSTTTIAFSGRVAPGKSPGMFVHVAVRLRERLRRMGTSSSRFRFLLLGGGLLVRDVRELARRHGLSPTSLPVSVDIRGVQTHADVLQIMREETDVFMAPNFGETFGIAVREAMARGVVPIVCACIGGPIESIRHGRNGYVVDCDKDGDALARQIIEVSQQNPEHRRRVSQHARRTVIPKYGRDAFDRRYASIYGMLVLLLRLREREEEGGSSRIFGE